MKVSVASPSLVTIARQSLVNVAGAGSWPVCGIPEAQREVQESASLPLSSEFYDRYPAVFEVGGVNVKFGPFSGLHKNIGDGTKLSEQIIIRANRIISEETFAGLPALIPMEDAVLVSGE